MKRDRVYILLGVFFVFLQIVAIVRNLFLGFVYFFWFCDFIPIILAVSFFFKRDQIVKGIINIGLFPQLIYLFSFIVRLFFGSSFLDETDLLFSYNAFIISSSIILHSASAIALGFVYKVKPRRNSLIYSFVGLVLIYFIIIVFTVSNDSINYVFLLSNFFDVRLFSVFWIPVTFLGVVLPTYGFQYLVYQYFGRRIG